jgi:hypothetical protein
MVLAYSHSEWFVPSLQDLLEPDKSSVRRCVWHKAKRSTKSDGAQLVRCSCPIAEQDAKNADQLLRELRKVHDGGARSLQILRGLSLLSLCKNVHRALNADTISDFWVTELKSNTHSPAQETSTPSARPTTPSTRPTTPSPRPTTPSPRPSTPKRPPRRISAAEVLEQLGVTVGKSVKCHGRGKKSDHCGNWISKSNGARITAISRELAGDWRLSNTVLKLLEELSSLVLCGRWHQDQAPLKFKEWTAIIKSKEAAREPQPSSSPINPRTPTRQSAQYPANDTPETQMSSVWTSPRRSRSPLSTATTPNSTHSAGRTSTPSPLDREPRQPKFERHQDQSYVSPTPISSRTRSTTKDRPYQTARPTFKSSTFEPFSTVKSPLKAAEHVRAKIRQKISPQELPSGFVYGFRRPGCDLIKIGTTTKTVAKRLGSIASQCKYTPNVVFQVATNHAMKVEHLVHLQFYRQNRRECLIDGRCNGGRGCAARHKEWFEGVSDTYAEAVVRAWVRWMNLEPYDVGGLLKEAWLVQAKLFNLNSPGDIWMRWTEITLVKTAREEVEEEAIDDVIRAEKVLRTVNELSSQLVPPKSVSTASREIRERYSGLAAPVTLSGQVDVFA